MLTQKTLPADWTPYNGQEFEDNISYLFCYADTTGKIKYDVGRCKDGKPFVVGNHFAFDLIKSIYAFAKIQEFKID